MSYRFYHIFDKYAQLDVQAIILDYSDLVLVVPSSIELVAPRRRLVITAAKLDPRMAMVEHIVVL